MTVTEPGNHEEDPAGRSGVIARVRELDPECDVDNVGRFFREIEAATKVLEQLGASNHPLQIAFDPHWRQDSRQ